VQRARAVRQGVDLRIRTQRGKEGLLLRSPALRARELLVLPQVDAGGAGEAAGDEVVRVEAGEPGRDELRELATEGDEVGGVRVEALEEAARESPWHPPSGHLAIVQAVRAGVNARCGAWPRTRAARRPGGARPPAC
jgi:hypothetical protein